MMAWKPVTAIEIEDTQTHLHLSVTHGMMEYDAVNFHYGKQDSKVIEKPCLID